MFETVRHFQGMGERRTWERQWEAARWIAAELSSFGVHADIRSYDDHGKPWPNVVAVVLGRKEPAKIVMAVAHLDSISDSEDGSAPGGDDNGSGVAAILEVGRALGGLKPDKSVYLCVFSNEEVRTAGSRRFARTARSERKDIEVVVNLDVLAYNRPRSLPVLKALSSHATWKGKAKGLWRAVRNFLYGLAYGDNVLLVAGKTTERALVRTVGKEMRRTAGLNVQEVVRDDCG